MPDRGVTYKEVVSGGDVKVQILDWVLQVLETVCDHFKEVVIQKLEEEGIPIKVVSHIYLLDREKGNWEAKSLSVYTVKVVEIGDLDERDRAVSCDVTYWRKFQDARYNNKFSVDLTIESGKNAMLDYAIWLLEYMYRNDKKTFQRLFSGEEWRLVKWSRGTSEWYYLYYFFDKEEVEHVKRLLKEVIDWVFSRVELKEVLKGERWIDGYIPPVPF